MLGALLSGIVAAEPMNGVKLEFRDGRPIVRDVYVNGEGPYRFLVDTGSTLNHIEPSLARTIGLRLTFQANLTSSSGRTIVSGTDGADVRLGSASAGEQVFLVGADSFHRISRDIQGVLGQAFLSRFDYQIDLANRRLVFGKQRRDDAGARIGFRSVDGRVIVATSLGRLVLDSGAHYLTRFGVRGTEETLQMITATGSMRVGTVFSRLAIEGRTWWRGDAVALPESHESGIEGLLPIGPFNSIYVSNSEAFIVFE